MTEAPLLIRPFLPTLNRSELMAVMVGGFATVAGSMLGAYVGVLRETLPNIAGHLVAASVMNAPAGLVIAKLLEPPPNAPANAHGTVAARASLPQARNIIDAAAQGARDGLKLAMNVGAMLVVFVALVALADALLAGSFRCWNHLSGQSIDPWTLRQVFAWVLWPLAWLMGIAPSECGAVAQLLGEKVVINEFVAYQHLAERMASAQPLSARSARIASYALCGFANFASIAIQLGGIGTMAPERRGELAQIGLRAMFGGLLATCLTATVARLLM